MFNVKLNTSQHMFAVLFHSLVLLIRLVWLLGDKINAISLRGRMFTLRCTGWYSFLFLPLYCSFQRDYFRLGLLSNPTLWVGFEELCDVEGKLFSSFLLITAINKFFS